MKIDDVDAVARAGSTSYADGKKIRDREASRRHRKKKREQQESIVQQLESLKLENNTIKRDAKFRDLFHIRSLLGHQCKEIENRLKDGVYESDQSAASRDTVNVQNIAWEEGIALSQLASEFGKIMRSCLSTEVFAGVERLWATSPDALEVLASELSPLKPEQKAALREVGAATSPTPEHRKRLHECIKSYADRLEQAQCIAQRLRELAMEAQTLKAQYDAVVPAVFARHEQALSDILTPLDWLRSMTSFHRNMPILHRLIAGDAFVDAMNAVEENCAKENPPIVVDTDDDTDAETRSEPESYHRDVSSIAKWPMKGIGLRKEFSSKYARQNMDKLREITLREGSSAVDNSSNPPLVGSISLVLEKYRDSLAQASAPSTSNQSSSSLSATRKQRRLAPRESSVNVTGKISLASNENLVSYHSGQTDYGLPTTSPSNPNATHYLQYVPNANSNPTPNSTPNPYPPLP